MTVGVLMVLFAMAAFALRPTQKMSEHNKQINLEAMIPEQFAGWQEDRTSYAQFVDPTLSEKVRKTYLQSLTRTYVNANGQHVMLAIAYGGDQNDMMQVHKPEICYNAQGFNVSENQDVTLNTAYGSFTARQMVAIKGLRAEPITYWITIGNKVAVNPVQWRLERIRYGLTGVVPDGLLFRVSTIGDNSQAEYAIQQKFVSDLMHSVDSVTRSRLLGVKDIA
jgi:EpsI family protein